MLLIVKCHTIDAKNCEYFTAMQRTRKSKERNSQVNTVISSRSSPSTFIPSLLLGATLSGPTECFDPLCPSLSQVSPCKKPDQALDRFARNLEVSLNNPRQSAYIGLRGTNMSDKPPKTNKNKQK